MAKLVFITPPFAGRDFELIAEKTTIGRSAQNTLVIEDKSVSSHHCDLMMYGEEFIVSDHGSSNGSFVAGVKVNGQLPLRNGDILRMGKIEVRLSAKREEDTSDSVSGVTAIHSFVRHLKDGEKHKAEPSPFVGELPPDTADSGEHTIVIPRGKSILDDPPAEKPAASPPSTIACGCCCGKYGWLVVIGVAIVAIALMAYLKFR